MVLCGECGCSVRVCEYGCRVLLVSAVMVVAGCC